MSKSQYTKFMALFMTLFVSMSVLSIVFFNPIFIAVAVITGGIIILTRMVHRQRRADRQAGADTASGLPTQSSF